MSRPYLNINSINYSSPVLTMNWTYFKARAGGSFSLGGLSNSFYINESLADNPGQTLTFSVTSLGLPSNAASTYNDPTPFVYNFTGTTSNTSNITIAVNGSIITSTTASGPTLSIFLQTVSTNFNNNAPSNFSSLAFTTAATGSLTIGAYNVGNYYNGATVSLIAASGSSTFKEASPGVTISTINGGSTNYNMVITYSGLGGSFDNLFFTA